MSQDFTVPAPNASPEKAGTCLRDLGEEERKFYGELATQPYVSILRPATSGEGAAEVRRITIGFASGQGIDDVKFNGRELSFDIRGRWELSEVADPLAQLALFLARSFPSQEAKPTRR